MITVEIQGMQALQASLGNQASQIPFAAARALTVTAHAVHAEIKRALAAGVQGGPTPYCANRVLRRRPIHGQRDNRRGLRQAWQILHWHRARAPVF